MSEFSAHAAPWPLSDSTEVSVTEATPQHEIDAMRRRADAHYADEKAGALTAPDGSYGAANAGDPPLAYPNARDCDLWTTADGAECRTCSVGFASIDEAARHRAIVRGRDCEHGQLARSCRVCELEKENARLRKQWMRVTLAARGSPLEIQDDIRELLSHKLDDADKAGYKRGVKAAAKVIDATVARESFDALTEHAVKCCAEDIRALLPKDGDK